MADFCSDRDSFAEVECCDAPAAAGATRAGLEAAPTAAAEAVPATAAEAAPAAAAEAAPAAAAAEVMPAAAAEAMPAATADAVLTGHEATADAASAGLEAVPATVDPAPTPAAEATSAAGETAPDRPEYYYIVSDSSGFVGAFTSLASARANTIDAFNLTPFVVQRVGVAAACPWERVWVVLYRGLDAVAFVSNDRSTALSYQTALARIGFAYEDDIDYWEQPVGAVIGPALKRLQGIQRAHDMYAGIAGDEKAQQNERDALAKLETMMAPRPDGPIAQLLDTEERITILDCIIPLVATTDADAPDAAAAAPNSDATAAAPTPDGAAAPNPDAVAAPTPDGAALDCTAPGPDAAAAAAAAAASSPDAVLHIGDAAPCSDATESGEGDADGDE